MNPVERLQTAMRRIGAFDALIDENSTHIIVCTPALPTGVWVNKLFVACARDKELDSVLREKLGVNDAPDTVNT